MAKSWESEYLNLVWTLNDHLSGMTELQHRMWADRRLSLGVKSRRNTYWESIREMMILADQTLKEGHND